MAANTVAAYRRDLALYAAFLGPLSLAEVAAEAGFSDQSQFSHHFKRLIGVTPGQFRKRVRIAKEA